jgi:hypothetical protein
VSETGHFVWVGRFIILLLSLLRPTPDLESCVAFWQRELNLQDWTISMLVVNERDLDNGTIGDVEPNRTSKTAVIRLMDENQSDLAGRLARADQRYTVVHEMVHLRRFTDGDLKWRNEGTTNAEANRLIRKHRRWLEWLAIED